MMRRSVWIALSVLAMLASGWTQAVAGVGWNDPISGATIAVSEKDNQVNAIPTIVWDHKCMWVLDTMPITFGCDRSALLGCSGECSVGVLADEWATLCVPASGTVCSGTLTKVTVLKYYEGKCQPDCSCADGHYLPYPVKVEIYAYKCR